MPSQPPVIRRVAGAIAILALWAVLLVGGFRGLLQHETAPTPYRVAPARDLKFGTDGKTALIMALHPKCPCSRASVSELTKLYSHATKPLKIVVLAYKPASEPDEWIESHALQSIRSLHAKIVIDADGAEAKRLGMTTSGQVIVYDAEGNLVFDGGITGSRAHEGDNLGEQLALAQINGRATERLSSSPVFGCSLFETTQ